MSSRGTLVSLDDLQTVARQLWDELAPTPGSVVWLAGDLGSGKTTFVRAFTHVLGASPARSPTYALVHRYPSPFGPLVHADCYRLRSPDEALDLDFHELQREARVLFIEWPEHAGVYAPPADAHLAFTHHDQPAGRVIRRVQ